MQIKRAEEILESPNTINVTYKNSPVWINRVEKDNSTVHITMLNTNTSMDVSADELIEK